MVNKNIMIIVEDEQLSNVLEMTLVDAYSNFEVFKHYNISQAKKDISKFSYHFFVIDISMLSTEIITDLFKFINENQNNHKIIIFSNFNNFNKIDNDIKIHSKFNAPFDVDIFLNAFI